MLSTHTANAVADKKTSVNILVNGKVRSFDFDELKTFHQGDSWFGCAVGFRAMQVAARELSDKILWSRDNLYMVSGHPGAGVKDAIELITATVSSKCFQLLENISSQGCSGSMKFEWWLSNNRQTLHIKLRDNIVPQQFFTLLERLSSDNILTHDEKKLERKKLEQMKSELSAKLWEHSLDTAFELEFLTTALKAGELPDAK